MNNVRIKCKNLFDKYQKSKYKKPKSINDIKVLIENNPTKLIHMLAWTQWDRSLVLMNELKDEYDKYSRCFNIKCQKNIIEIQKMNKLNSNKKNKISKIKKLKRCNGCKLVMYCCRYCQKYDWNIGKHWKQCNKLRNMFS